MAASNLVENLCCPACPVVELLKVQNNSSDGQQSTASSFYAQTPPLTTRLTTKEMAETVLFDIAGSIKFSETTYSKLKTKNTKSSKKKPKKEKSGLI
jgi:hypothetical protein